MQQSVINEELEKLTALLQKEKEEDFERFREEVLSLTLKEKKARGLTWYPVEVNRDGYIFGERAFVVIERTALRDTPHRFRPGMPVELFSLAEDKFKSDDKAQRKNGVIHFVDKNKMKIILNSKDLPDWLKLGQLGIDLLFDERTYIEMEKVLRKVKEARGNRLAELKAIFYQQLEPQVGVLPTIHHAYLNEGQQKAVQNILASYDVSIVHGPPGTGKTTTIVNAIKLLCESEKVILVTAPSNAAVDLLAERCSKKGLNVVRIGNISRVEESIISLTLDARLSAHPESKNIKKIRIEAARARAEARKFKRKFGHVEREARKDSYKEARDLEDWAKQLEERMLSEILETAQVVACTLVNSAHRVLERLKFRTVVIDEAAQALEPATWIPISRASRVVLAGDPFQLPPTVKSFQAKKEGLGITLLEKCVQNFKEVNFLNIQYRMNETIMNFSNTQFYDQQLIAAEEVKDWKLNVGGDQPVSFIDTAGCGFGEELNPKTESKFNSGEFFIFREYFLQFVKTLTEHEEEMPSIAVIAPYKAQAIYIKEEFLKDELCAPYEEFVTINTIDSFQGQERDVVFISLVRSNEKSEIGFLSDYRRMNVAMTRAKKKLVVIGDSATIGNDTFYGAFISYTEQIDGYRSAWEFMS